MSPNKKFNLKVAFVGILLIAISGAAYLMFSSAATVSDCGSTTVQNYDYDVPFGNAVWNQKVCGLPKHPKSDDYASRFYNWSGARRTEPLEGEIVVDNFFRMSMHYEDPAGTYSQPIYYASDANGKTKKVLTSPNSPSNLDGVKSIYSTDWDRKKSNPDTPIPWSSSWSAGNNADAQMIILDEENGRIYEISGYTPLCLDPNRICVGTANIGRDEITGEIIDYRTYEGPLKRRGVGLSWLAGLVTAEEVAAGEIRHALSVAIPNTARGPECAENQLLPNTAEGKDCGIAVAPATKFEYKTQENHWSSKSPYDVIYTDNSHLIPEGMRFALDLTDQEIEDWINSNSRLTDNPRLTETARIFARAFRDYGFFIGDTSFNANIQNTGALNPDEADLWKSLGFDDSSKAKNFLWGLIEKEDIYVVDPPTVTCEDNNQSQYYCLWTQASYDGYTPPPDTQMPTVSITSPVDNSTVKGTITVSANASDNVAVSKVEFYVDSQLKATSTSSPYSFSLDTTKLTDGSHTIEAKAYDSSGNVRNVAVTVTVDNTIPQPQVVCDFDGDEIVGLADLARLILEYNNNVSPYNNGDCDGNGYVNLADLAILILNYDS